MRLIKAWFKKYRQSKLSINSVVVQLSHDMNNNLLAIKAITGNLKSAITENEDTVIQNNLNSINQMVSYAMAHLDLTNVFSSHVEKYFDPVLEFSILDCVYEALNIYPFASLNQKKFIEIAHEEKDFSVQSNKKLFKNIFICIIKNALYAVHNNGSGTVIISLENIDKKNAICFKYPRVIDSLKNENIISLGLPEEPYYGFYFIANVIKKLKGRIYFKNEYNSQVILTILF